VQYDGKVRAGSSVAASGGRPRRSPHASVSSRESILEAAKQLFLQHGYDAVNMDELALAAGISRRTLYNQFSGKQTIFRAMIERQWSQLDRGDEAELTARSDVADVLREVARRTLALVMRPDHVALVRMVIAESRRFPWISEEFYRIGGRPRMQLFIAYLRDLARHGLLACEYPELAAYQFIGLLEEALHWPNVMASGPAFELPAVEVVIEEAVRTFLARYRPQRENVSC
jgi:AcrR family transcriptional regulator